MNTSNPLASALHPSPAAAAAATEILGNAQDRRASMVAQRVRDSLVVDEAVLFECVNEAIAGLDPHKAEVFRRALFVSPDFGRSIKRVTTDIGVVLSLAKTFEDDASFVDAAGLLHDINFTAFEGKVADFALLLIETDMRSAQDARQGKANVDVILYELLPYDVIKRRLQTLYAFVLVAAGRLDPARLH